MSTKKQELVIDTSAFFAGTRKLRSFVESGAKLSTIDLVVFEFIKVIDDEMTQARRSRKAGRLEMLQSLKERFPMLLRVLEVEVRSPNFSIDDVDELYSAISEGHDPGDSMIWLKMQKIGLGTIVTDNTSDWSRLGAKVVGLR